METAVSKLKFLEKDSKRFIWFLKLEAYRRLRNDEAFGIQRFSELGAEVLASSWVDFRRGWKELFRAQEETDVDLPLFRAGYLHDLPSLHDGVHRDQHKKLVAGCRDIYVGRLVFLDACEVKHDPIEKAPLQLHTRRVERVVS